LPEEISELKNLEELLLYGNFFDVDEMQKIKELLPYTKISF